MLAMMLIFAAAVAGAIGRTSPRRDRPLQRRRSDTSDQAALDIAAAIGNAGESARVALHTIALQAQTLTGSELAAAGIGGDATNPFLVWAHLGMPPEQVRQIGRLPRRVGLLALLTDENRAVRLRDARHHLGYVGLPPHHAPITTFLGVPIRFRGRVAGCLCLGNKRDGAEFTLEDQQMAEMLAARAGDALEAARTQEPNAWLQSVLDEMPEGVVVLNTRGEVTLENRPLGSLAHADPHERPDSSTPRMLDLSLPSGDRLSPRDVPAARAVADGEVTIGRELIARGRDNRPVPLLVSAAPILKHDGSLDGAVMVCQEVSAVRELQRVREEWASIVAHELRQPISVIAVRCSLLLRGHLSSEQRDSLEQIARSVHGLGRMVTDLMDASLLESDRLRVTFERLDIGELLRDVVRRTPLAAARTRTAIPHDLRLSVRGDAQRLEQVLANLLSNAVKYAAPDTEIVVDLSLAAGRAHIRVMNAGDPIPEDELPFVFNRFARARTAGPRKVKGLGLGLYIAKGLVTAHHGRIWAESAPGVGTTFHVALPLDGSPVPVLPAAPPLDRPTTLSWKESA